VTKGKNVNVRWEVKARQSRQEMKY